MQQTADRKIKLEEEKQHYTQQNNGLEQYLPKQQSYEQAAIQYVEDDQQHYDDDYINHNEDEAE